VARILRRRRDGACIFLDGEKNLCRIHGTLGEREKPLACRLFPFTFVSGDEADPRPRVGCHFACKGLAAGDGAPVAGEKRALEELAGDLSRVHDLSPPRAPLVWDEQRSYTREELELVATLVTNEVLDANRPFPDRILAVARFLDLFAKSAFTQVKDEKRRDFIEILASGVREQVKKGIVTPATGRPGFPERLLFRQIIALAVRRDPPTLITAGMLRRSVRRVGGLISGVAFTTGGGSFTPTGRDRRVRLGDVLRLAPTADPASPEADGALSRYFAAHLSARRVLDPDFRPGEVLAAFGLLLRQYPAILLYARAACFARGGDRLESTDYASALRTADWTFGHVAYTSGVVGQVRARLLRDLDAPFQHLPFYAQRP
jgi:Fe-S-cluster containining protein